MGKTLTFILLIIGIQTFAQVNNLHKKFFVQVKDTIVLDSLPIIPSSIEVKSHGQAIHNFKLLWQKSTIIFPSPLDSVFITYRVFPFSLKPDTSTSRAIIIPRYSEIEPVPGLQLSNQTTDLETEGRISRGVFFGSQSQPSLTSEFNLVIHGKLDKNTEIQAAIADNALSDNDLSGTYNFQDFDRAVINIKFPHSSVAMGDISVKNQTGYFASFSRSIRGGDYFSDNDSTLWHGGFGVQKGIFQRMQLMGEEGNQGPYRLIGKKGENMIIIITGSERVYINGQRKKRGADFDYTIDYLRGELTFTPNCPITKDSRITVEFQYWAFDYQRYSTWLEMGKAFTHGTMYYGFFQVKDNRLSPTRPLDKEQINILYNAGDSASYATIFAADSVAPDPGKILYCKQDTTVNNETFTIFKYCNSQQAVWQVNFSYVGQGNGDYTLDRLHVNGRVFRWVGKGKGDYMPVRRLPMPQRNTITYAGGRWTTGNMGVDYELAFNDFDKNLFSPFDDNDNRSVNIRFGLGKKMANQQHSDSVFVRYMLMNSSFNAFSPFLPVEFNRDWNILFGSWQQAHLVSIGNNFLSNGNVKDVLQGDMLFYPKIYKGARINNTLVINTKKWNINSWTSYNMSQQDQINSSFLRTQQMIRHRIKKTVMGLDLEAERNIHTADSLLSWSYAFVDYNFSLLRGDSTNNNLTITSGQRYDWIYTSQGLKPLIIATNLKLQWHLTHGRLSNNTTLLMRNLRDTGQMTKTLLLRSAGQMQIPHIGSISLVAETGRGTQGITEYYFVRVPTGQGQYAWIDFNHDGIQQLNEFQPTQFTDQANFTRVTLPSQKYIPVFVQRLSLGLSLVPSIKGKTLIAKLFNHINNELSANVTSKDKYPGPATVDYQDTSIVFFQANLGNNLTAQLCKRLSLNFLISKNINKDLLLGGEKLLITHLQKISLKYGLANSLNLTASLWTRSNHSRSQLFLAENYQVYEHGADLTLSQSGLKFQTTANIQYKSAISPDTSSLINTAKADFNLTWAFAKNLRITDIATVMYNTISGQPNEQVAYMIMQGFGQGWNLSNALSLSLRINKTFTLQADYQLRLARSHPIHNFGFKITGWF